MEEEARRQALAADEALARAVASGDRRAFAALVDRDTLRLLRFARSLIGEPAEAEDVVQEAFLAFWETAPRWQADALITTWLHRVCYTRCVDRLRRRRAHAELNEAADRADPDAPEPDSGIIGRERSESLAQALARLPPRQRTAVILFHMQELSQRDAAAVMGVSEEALESLLARARRQMRALLRE